MESISVLLWGQETKAPRHCYPASRWDHKPGLNAKPMLGEEVGKKQKVCYGRDDFLQGAVARVLTHPAVL